jgi:hypothetical protein
MEQTQKGDCGLGCGAGASRQVAAEGSRGCGEHVVASGLESTLAMPVTSSIDG